MIRGLEISAVLAAVGLGLRHGLDWDHLASIADLSSASTSRRSGLFSSTLYAVGHAAVVLALGVVAITLGAHLPESIDAVMSRVVGVSLVAFGGWVAYTLARKGRAARLRSRWMLLLDGVSRLVRRGRPTDPEIVVIEHEHPETLHHDQFVDRRAGTPPPKAAAAHRHTHVGVVPSDPFVTRSAWTAIVIGMVHGIGVETPTQVMVLGTAAGAGSSAVALVLLTVFVVGLLASNTFVALCAATGLFSAEKAYPLFVGISVTVALASVVLGMSMLIGSPLV